MSRREENTPLSMAFGKAVRTLRGRMGLSQEEFANRAEIDRAYYGIIERGGHTPTIATVWKIADGLGARPRDVIAAVERQCEADQAVTKKKPTAKAATGSAK